MEGQSRLKLVKSRGQGDLAADAAHAGFTILLEIWHSAIEDLVRDMSPGQLRILLIVDGAGSVSLERLAGALATSTLATSVICDHMEEAGLLRAARGVPGLGVIVISLTAAGRRLAAQIREQRRAVLDHVLQTLRPDGRESLARALGEFAAMQE